jgi:hypothetical protein
MAVGQRGLAILRGQNDAKQQLGVGFGTANLETMCRR